MMVLNKDSRARAVRLLDRTVPDQKKTIFQDPRRIWAIKFENLITRPCQDKKLWRFRKKSDKYQIIFWDQWYNGTREPIMIDSLGTKGDLRNLKPEICTKFNSHGKKFWRFLETVKIIASQLSSAYWNRIFWNAV